MNASRLIYAMAAGSHVTRAAWRCLNAGFGTVHNTGRTRKPGRPLPSAPHPVHKLALLFVIPVAVLAQSSGGAIRGTITDPSGAVIQGAVVNIVQAGTGETRQLRSNSTGLYDAPNLPIGTYRLTAMARGFSTVARTGIEVRVGSERIVDVELTIGPAEQTVTATFRLYARVDACQSKTKQLFS